MERPRPGRRLDVSEHLERLSLVRGRPSASGRSGSLPDKITGRKIRHLGRAVIIRLSQTNGCMLSFDTAMIPTVSDSAWKVERFPGLLLRTLVT